MSNNHNNNNGQHRRATSLGKSHLRSPWPQQLVQQRPGNNIVAARLARTSSWSDITGLIATHSAMAQPPQVVDADCSESQQLQQSRLRRTSMRRMVRFRMSSTSSSSSSSLVSTTPLTTPTRTDVDPSTWNSSSSSSPSAALAAPPPVSDNGKTGATQAKEEVVAVMGGAKTDAVPCHWPTASVDTLPADERSGRPPLLLLRSSSPWQPVGPDETTCGSSSSSSSGINSLPASPCSSSSFSSSLSSSVGSSLPSVEASTQTRSTTTTTTEPVTPTTNRWSDSSTDPTLQQQQRHHGVLVRQVSRFSVMQSPPLDTVDPPPSIDSIISSSPPHRQVLTAQSSTASALSTTSSTAAAIPSGERGGSSHHHRQRQRGRSERNRTANGGGGSRSAHSRARRQRSNMSAVSASATSIGSRDSTSETPIVRSTQQRRRNRNAEANVDPEEESRRKLGGIWPHGMSPMFAMLAATLGLFNISRFSMLSIEYGGNFIVQFVLLTFLFGVPMLCFHGCLGQFLGSNVIDMWRISPVFKGVGIALLIGQAIGGLYSVVGVAWMFFYFRDSFIAQEDRYKWSKSPTNYSLSLEDSIPDYFHARVLQRSNPSVPALNFVSLKFELAFNLAVIWMIIFVALGKGLRSYGKVVYAFGTLPVLGFFVVCVKVLGYSSAIPTAGIGSVLDQTHWNEFFIDTRVWVIAAREVFMTWGVCGAIVMQITSHNRYGHHLRRDITVVIGLTLFVLLLSGFLASACLQVINYRGPYEYTVSSYETDKSFQFLKNTRYSRQQQQSFNGGRPHQTRYEEFHNNLVMGLAVRRGDDGPGDRSGYQPIRMATELFPALVAVIGATELSPFWAVLFYFSLVAFGIAQQLAIWHCVISGIVAFRSCCFKSWETTITFCTCLIGFSASLPLATELGISIVYHLDYVFGAMWWLMMIYVIEIAAVLIVRGRPYNGESIVAVLIKGPGCLANWAVPMLTFSWSVVLPIGLLVLSISSFKTGHLCDMFNWDLSEGYAYWPLWARQTGTMLQLVCLLLIPTVGIIQCFRYLTSGPSDLFERIKLLYRPHFRTYLIPPEPTTVRAASRTSRSQASRQRSRSARSRSRSRSPSDDRINFPDPPPKYTPPPTYNTATGARIAKMFRESIRRSIRQIREMATPVQSPGNTVTSMAELELGGATRHHHSHQVSVTRHLPPAYTSVIMEMRTTDGTVEAINERLTQMVAENSSRSHTSEAASTSALSESSDNTISSDTASSSSSSGLSAAELTRLLRDSFRRSARNTIRSSLRFIRSVKNGKPANSSEPTGSDSVSVAGVVTDDETGTDTDGGARHLVHGATRIHTSNVVVNLPNGDQSESVA